jgi:hypothetical protein
VAVTASVPTGKCDAEEVVQVATPGLPETVLGAQPVFALQVTLPPGSIGFIPFLLGLRLFTRLFSPVMVAVNVTDCAYVDGFGVEVTAVVVLARLMTWPPANVPEPPRLFESPEYVAVTVYVPTASVEVLMEVAVPDTNASVSNRLPFT